MSLIAILLAASTGLANCPPRIRTGIHPADVLASCLQNSAPNQRGACMGRAEHMCMTIAGAHAPSDQLRCAIAERNAWQCLAARVSEAEGGADPLRLADRAQTSGTDWGAWADRLSTIDKPDSKSDVRLRMARAEAKGFAGSVISHLAQGAAIPVP